MSARDALPIVGMSDEAEALGLAISALRESLEKRWAETHGASDEFAAILRVEIDERERAIALLARRACVLGLQRARAAA